MAADLQLSSTHLRSLSADAGFRAAVGAATPLGIDANSGIAKRFVEIFGCPPWQVGLDPEVLAIPSITSLNIVFTSTLLPKLPGQTMDEGTSIQQQMTKSLLNAVCAAGFENPSLLDRFKTGEATVYVQTENPGIASKMGEEARLVLLDIFGARFNIPNLGMRAVAVRGLPQGAAAAVTLNLYTTTEPDPPYALRSIDARALEKVKKEFGPNIRVREIGYKENRYLIEGLGPRWPGGELDEPGMVFDDRNIMDGQRQARLAFTGFLRAMDMLGFNLDRVLRINGAVRSRAGFGGQSAILNAASEVAKERFSENMVPARIDKGMTAEQEKGNPSLILDVMFETA